MQDLDLQKPPNESKPDSRPSLPGTRLGLWIGVIVLFLPLVVYLFCLCPTVFVGDAGDFLTASFTLGVPHPPGYPLYTLLGHLFMQLPIPGGLSQPAYRMNMLSAVAAWGACLFMFLYLRRVLRTEWAALAGALALAFSAQFWEHAEIAEVYTLQVFFIALIFYLAVLYVQERKIGWALLLAFVMGLALTHHYAVLLFYPGVLIFIGMNGGLRMRLHVWLLAIFLAVVGLTPYAYLPMVHYKTPLGEVVFAASEEEAAALPMNVVAATETPLQYFLYYTSRHFYSLGREYTHTPEALPQRTTTPMVFRRFLEVTNNDFAVPLLLFAVIGWIALIVSLRRKLKPSDSTPIKIPRAAFLPPALGYILYFLVVHFFPSGDILAAPLENLAVVVPPLLIPLQAALAPIIALGLDTSLRWVAAYVRAQGITDLATSAKFRTFAGLLAIAAFALIAINAWRNAETGDKSQSVISYNYALNVLDSCDPGAILLTTGDETFLFWYVQACEPSRNPGDTVPGYRKDVWATNWIHNLESLQMLADEPEAMRTVMENFVLNTGYYGPYLELFDVPYISNYYGPRPINSTFIAHTFADSTLIMGLDVVLRGLTYSFRRPGDVPDVALPEVRRRAQLDPIVEGAAPMMVIDYFDARPFDDYRSEGLPRFEGASADISSMDLESYMRVSLEAQEMEVLARYQDSLYRFGIQALLSDTEQSKQEAFSFLFKCVSLDPSGWFGWKELGDASLGLGRLESADGAYRQVVELSAIKGDVEPSLEAGAHSGIAHVALILRDLDRAEREANIALALDPSNSLARAVLEELLRQPPEPDIPPEDRDPDDVTDDDTGIDTNDDIEAGLREFNK